MKDKAATPRAATPGDGASSQRVDPAPGATPEPTIAPAPTPAASTAPASACHKASPEVCAIESEIFRRVNALRAERGAKPFKFSANLGYVSRDWSAQQARGSGISHRGFPKERSAAYAKEFPSSRGRIRAENVARASGLSPSAVAAQFFQMWEGSRGHRENMLGSFGAIGIGVARSGNGWVGTQLFGETDEP